MDVRLVGAARRAACTKNNGGERMMFRGWDTSRVNHPRVLAWSMLVVPVAFGLTSVWLGADSNFDLLYYHVYTAYAFLHGRLTLDFAPIGMGSYMNPLMDVLYYGMAMHWPSRLTGFVMGAIHGLNFVLLLGIARRCLPDLPAEDRYRLPLLLAVAGCVTTNFLSEIGNAMGDNTTALLELAALFTVLAGWEKLLAAKRDAIGVVLLAGLLAGLGAGLKLTNGPYTVALCVSFVALPLSPGQRIKLAFLFGIGVLAGVLLTGYWYLALWLHFGNPLYPQYSAFFPNELTRPIGAMDTRWPPKGLVDTLLWPFLISLDPLRVGQIQVREILWPLAYLLFLLWGAMALRRRFRPGPDADPRRLYLLIYVGLGFILWMKVFSVFRYLVPVELVAPLAVFLVLRRCFEYGLARRLAAWALGAGAVVVLAGGTATWGHEPWADPLFSAELPPLETPSNTSVMMVKASPPYGWLVTQFPEQIAFVGVRQTFPESHAYRARLREVIAARKGPVYAVVQAYYANRADTLERQNAWASRLGFESGARGCGLLHWAETHLHLRAEVHDTDATGTQCVLALLPSDHEETDLEDRAAAEKAAGFVAQYGYQLDVGSCRTYMAHVGQSSYPYQWCRVTDLSGTGSVAKRNR